MKKVVHFGAGNIGRGFIGALFSQSGYHVTFVDIADEIISRLNEEKAYKVKTAEDQPKVTEIQNVLGLNNMKQEEAVIKAIEEATYITTAIGPNILPHIAPLIAKGLKGRLDSSNEKVYVIACENQISATDILKGHILKAMDDDATNKIEGTVHFFNSAVDRIVPIQDNKNSLDVLVEPYFEWVVETIEDIPTVEGMTKVADLAPFIERKLFTVNTGHAVTAYFGYLDGKETIDQTLNDPSIYEKVKATIEETGAYLIKRYELDEAEHQKYIKKILGRFQNQHLHDDVTRVGRSPIRKLGAEDRLVKPLVEAKKLGLSYQNLASAIAACLLFDVGEDPEAAQLQKMIQEHGITYVLNELSLLNETDEAVQTIVEKYESLKAEYRK
ncbi:mannitol-1-phosphate 5-dehydrogenase [Niallia endozanthoxylica]|uniref:Mannitol-1-phosphate 5-dehydrogenase n=1 Tax=Niallia endozanthoxylica TaxID=2036016 RepID=A0A5J5HYK6_9BACI|nr:mannitol-1-phosphate 5-dehydrogenase [Niallia endozanthoxylica]KAA9027603.1 mannitol-1-phosphate 5-dehydrogenase [Niallia endozanthoxylica]